ncbi:hypothetical protein K2173_021095 [Erythroxylum novogranatense]|uniref:Myb/SANT-like domain-containing protein n=1 Tax=Erythroxylum novogranatense TaxID=1862640 RepID=A0AAV8TPI3_9ROSI|nr:hypothetical protein K2173_021095 [Erythroxylum novogranatense]
MNSSSTIDSQSSKGTKGKWNYDEDVVLVSCMVNLHNVETYNADTGFKAGYLNELERMVATKLPNSNLKARPHIESRIKTLKEEWSIIYDMVKKDTSGFGWDSERKMVTAEDHVWNSYLSISIELLTCFNHKDAAQFRRKSFPFYNELTGIYGKDRATENDAQIAVDILEEMERQEGVGESNEGGEDQYEHGLHDIDESFIRPQASNLERQAGNIFKKRKNRRNDRGEANCADSLIVAVRKLGDTINHIGKKLCKSIGTERYIEQRLKQLDSSLGEIEGLTDDERDTALGKFLDHLTQMLVFFTISPSQRIRWVRRFFATH